MKEIDIEWMRRIDAAEEKYDRGVPLNSKTHRCTKEVFIARYFKFLENKYFKLKIEDKIYYAWFHKTSSTLHSTDKHNGEKCHSYGVEKYLGFNDSEYTISFRDERCDWQSFKLHWNKIYTIKYEEITPDQYWDIVKLFIDDDGVQKSEEEQIASSGSSKEE